MLKLDNEFLLYLIEFHTGNTINIVFTAVATIGWVALKYYYKYKNAQRAKIVARMSEKERREEELRIEEKGNRSPLFTFTT